MATGGASETGGVNDIEKGTDETFDNLCSVCIKRNKNTEGSKYCTDCQKYFCSDCVNFHNEFPALQDHQILDKAKLQPGSSVQFPMVPTERCKVHGHKPVDMYYRQHDAVGCATCMVMQHSACKDKEYVPDYIKRVKFESSSSVVKQLGTIASSLGQLQENFLKDKKNLQSSKDKSMQQIRKFRQEINEQIDLLEKNTVEDLDEVLQSLNDKIDSTLKELQAALIDVQSAQDNLKSAGNNAAQMFISIKMAKNADAHAKKTVTTTQYPVCSTDISFVSNQKLQDLLKKTETLGSISMPEGLKSQLRDSSPLPSVDTIQTNTNSHGSKSSLPLMQVINSKKYTVREKSDSEDRRCFIRSICELDDGTIILSDYHKDKLKRLDSTYMVRDSCKVPSSPCQVCTISSQEVAVCCGFSCLIQFVSTGLTMQKTRQIKPGFYCEGLAYNDEKLFISDRFSSVYVYTLTGERLQQLKYSQLEPSFLEKMLVNLVNIYMINIAVSIDGSTIYITHREKGLIILNRNGQLVGEFTDPKLTGAKDVCLYKNNSVLVCGEDSYNVLQFTSDGKLIGEVLKRDKGCSALCYCKKTSKLIIAHDGIEVYDIKE